MPASDIFELSVDQSYGGQNIVNVHHFIQIGIDGTGTWQDALFSVWEDNYKAPFLAMMTDQLTVDQIRMRRLFPTQTQQTITAVATDGDLVAPGIAPHLACLLRQRGFPTGRKGTGGVKIAGVPVPSVLNGRIAVTYAGIVAAYGNVSEADITDGGTGYTFRAGVLSQSDGSFRAIEKSQVTPRIVTVRSRQIGVGQ